MRRTRLRRRGDPTSNLYAFVRDAIAAYYAKHPKPAMAKTVNFEEVLYQLNLAAPYFTDSSFLQGSNALLQPRGLPDVLGNGGASRAVDGNVLRHLSTSLLDALVDEFIARSAVATTSKSVQIDCLRTFLDDLETEFDIGIVTLNYDDMFTQARPDLFTGFDKATGAFESRAVLERGEWGFIYHLHGSFHFAMAERMSDMHGIFWEGTPKAGAAVQSTGRNVRTSMEGTGFPNTTIVAGHGKTQQILRNPFRTFFAQTNRLIQDADSLLFLGYGFGDLHLNAAFSEVRDRRRPAVVVGWAPDDEDSLPFRMDVWVENLVNTLPFNVNAMAAPGATTAAVVADLKAAREFEVSNDPKYPLAVWYGGFLAACAETRQIVSYLS